MEGWLYSVCTPRSTCVQKLRSGMRPTACEVYGDCLGCYRNIGRDCRPGSVRGPVRGIQLLREVAGSLSRIARTAYRLIDKAARPTRRSPLVVLQPLIHSVQLSAASAQAQRKNRASWVMAPTSRVRPGIGAWPASATTAFTFNILRADCRCSDISRAP